MNRLALALALFLLPSCAVATVGSGASLTGSALDPTAAAGGGGGTSGNIAVQIDCRSFGQTASATEGAAGTLNIKYATPVMCWASSTTVSGTAINVSGWVPDVFVAWDWDDSSLGSVSRGGLSMDLGKSVGVIAAHAFKPSTFADTCGGGTNSLHTVTARVYSTIAGAVESDSATMNICVEDPATTWATTKTVVYCNEATCTDDPGAPAGATNGGDATSSANLAAALRKCETDGASRRILFEGGVTFGPTSSTSLSMGSQSCYVGSYGTGNAKISFSSVSDTTVEFSMNATCGGYRFDNLTFSGSGTGPKLMGGSAADSGCIALIDSGVSTTPGEELASTIQSDPTGEALNSEIYLFKWDYQAHGSSNNSVYDFVKYFASVGSTITKSGEHLIRFPQANYIVIDATKFDGNQGGLDGRHLIAVRNNCGSVGTCTNSPFDDMIAITRNELRGRAAGAALVEFLNDGNGPLTESVKTYDVDLIWNLFSKHTSGNVPRSPILSNLGECNCGEEMKRFRFIGNVIDAFAFDSSSSRMLELNGNSPSDIAFIGNVMAGTGDANNPVAIVSGSPTNMTHKNNVCWENGTGACDLFPSVAEASTDLNLGGTDPFDRAAGPPDTLDSFDFNDVLITSSNTLLKGQGEISAVPTDIESETVPQSADYDAGVDDE